MTEIFTDKNGEKWEIYHYYFGPDSDTRIIRKLPKPEINNTQLARGALAWADLLDIVDQKIDNALQKIANSK